MTKTSFYIFAAGTTLALVIAIFIPTHTVMAQSFFGPPRNAFDLKDLIIGLINNVFVPLIFSLAFIVFIWGVFRYFIAGAADPTEQEKGKHFIMYGLIGLVIMLSVWGLVNVLTGTFGLNSSYVPAYPTLPTNP